MIKYIVLAALLVGCSNPGNYEQLREKMPAKVNIIGMTPSYGGVVLEIKLEDGTRCITVQRQGHMGGVDCDWR